ncbi:MAG: shikimate dehydrogenase [Acetivibrio ethanolgignens]
MTPEITGRTQLICLLGSPVAHSASPLMHNASFEALGLPYRYLCFDVTEDKMREAVDALRLFHARGFNCTMPVKTVMAELADELSPAARLMGAVNTVVIENGRLIGHNTDGIGYMQSVKEAGFSILGKKMTLLGAGGAATAICVQAALDGLAEIEVFSRPGERFQKMEELSKKLEKESGCQILVKELSDKKELEKSLADSAILTNATSVGMAPHEEACPLPEDIVLPSCLIVSDIIYNPRQTRLLKLAEHHGCPYFNGMYMLLFQGAAAFELWTGQKMPLEEIKRRYFSLEG